MEVSIQSTNNQSVVRSTTFNDKYWKMGEKLLDEAGIVVNGDNPWDVKIHNSNLFKRIFVQGTLGIGEAYMEGWWDCDNLDQLAAKVIKANMDEKIKNDKRLLFDIIISKLFNRQSKKRAFQVAETHYNLNTDLFESMLDKRLAYSCGYWKGETTLDGAQENKLQLICDKLDLEPGMKVLDIGSGWGSFIKYAAENYDVSVTGITVSKEQVKYSRQSCKGLSVDVKLQDYREITGEFDRIVSVGMIEHVGHKNYRTFMETTYKALKENGLFLLHTIGGNESKTRTDKWLDKYIFPNGSIPSITQLGKAIEGLYTMEDWHNFGADYDKTLMAWYDNFTKNWKNIKSNFNEKFYRMWTYYLLTSAGSFRARKNQLWQIVLAKNGISWGYKFRY